MKAWIKQSGELRLVEVPLPEERSDEMLVRVLAVSLNRGEVRGVALAADGTRPGWDIAGVVEQQARDGSGPAAGTRVVAILRGAGWAEFAAVPVSQAAPIPDEVEPELAATLPVAGLTVLRAFDVAGPLLGASVLVNGASGGVGQLAIQLGAMSGANVTAVTSRKALRAALEELGAREVVSSMRDASGPYDLVLESVGGEHLAAAIGLVARGGKVVTIGNSSEQETTFNARTLYGKGGASVYGLLIFEEVESRRVGPRHLSRLLELVRSGRLRPPVSIRRPWTELPDALRQLEKREFAGKAVLTIS